MPAHRPSLAVLALVIAAPLAVPLSAPLSAQSIPVVNHSFESPAIPANSFATGSPPPGWTQVGTFGPSRVSGVLDPNGSTLYGTVPDGENVAVLFLLDDNGDHSVFAGIEAGLEQTLTTTLATDTRYVLRVDVGNLGNDPNPPHNQWQFAGFPGYRIELLAGGVVIASDENTVAPADAAFETATAEVTIGATHALAGTPLGIRLINLNADVGIEVNFDDVRLTADSCSALGGGCTGEAPPECASGRPSASAAFTIACPTLALPCSSAPVLLVGTCAPAPVGLPTGIGCGPCTLWVAASFGAFPDPLVVPPGLPIGLELCAQCGCITSTAPCVDLSAGLRLVIGD